MGSSFISNQESANDWLKVYQSHVWCFARCQISRPRGKSRRGTYTPTIIPNKQSDVAVFYFPYCFIVCALVRRLAGASWFIWARRECSRRHWGRLWPPDYVLSLSVPLVWVGNIVSVHALMDHLGISIVCTVQRTLHFFRYQPLSAISTTIWKCLESVFALFRRCSCRSKNVRWIFQ